MTHGTSLSLASALAALLVCGIGGCNDVTRNSDMHFGESFHTVFANQKLNPDAGAVGTPVSGYDGQKAANTMGQYQNKPAPVKAGAKAGGGEA
ncbi:hypothetical protein [Desulfolutivibrio sulfodismutans]|uniref:hypothetical protein n=1 Tax=Desulfolutivibrio sulfodismutans TaxID=63561 RepID=UPI00159D987F|nr:hypothetical protein [Desulfolutivibrio sulfodismutans]QLA13989.1 hypothetical protein GD606_17820 [Desulfolutivibrio sulfodismutans DSM 3696]